MLAGLRERGIAPARVLEPTCGSGVFLAEAAAAFPAAQIVGIEYQRERYGAALAALVEQHAGLSVRFDNAYALDFVSLPWRGSGPLLIVGNPPWITAAALGCAAGDVLQPPRTNPKGLRGLAARTGAANFDVAEFLILKLLAQFRAEPLHVALLVKESVARSVLAAAGTSGHAVTSAEFVRIDARRWFGAAVDAGCLFFSTTPNGASPTTPGGSSQDAGGALDLSVAIRPEFAQAPVAWFRPAAPRRPVTSAPIVFRQGIKHDAADVFELALVEGCWRNGYGEIVDVEPEHIYPLLKARALHAGAAAGAMALIVPHTRLGAATAGLERSAPRLWRYLCAHAARIGARKSSIYRNAPQFALFGIGPYSFAPWKVAVAGLYAQPRFRVVGPRAGRPVLLGDTSYFASFARGADARAFAALCASPAVTATLAERIVRGKRPITKALLDGIDWPAFVTRRDPVHERLRALLGEGREA